MTLPVASLGTSIKTNERVLSYLQIFLYQIQHDDELTENQHSMILKRERWILNQEVFKLKLEGIDG